MAQPTSRKRKLQHHQKSNTTEDESVSNRLYSPTSSPTSMNALENMSTLEEIDRNVELDSCSSKKESIEQPNVSHLPDLPIFGPANNAKVSVIKKGKRPRRQSLDGDSLTSKKRTVNCSNNDQLCKTKRNRKSSAPALTVRPFSSGSPAFTGVHKKLILRRSEKQDFQNGCSNQDTKTNQIKELLNARIGGTETGSPMPVSVSEILEPAVGAVKCVSPRNSLTEREDYDSNLDKDTCGDSDDDLPDVLGSSQENHSSKSTIKQNDLVWVKFKKYPHWPAIVKNVHCKKKKAHRVVFTFIGEMFEGDRGTIMRLSYKPNSIIPFGGEDHQNFKEKGLLSQYSEYFKAAVEKTEYFIMKKATQPTLDMQEFFKFDLNPGLRTEFRDVDRCERNPDRLSNTNTDCYEDESEGKRQEASATDDDDEEDDGDDDEDDDNEDDDKNGEEIVHDLIESSNASVSPLKPIQERRILSNKRFLEFMKTKRMQDHLCKVKEGKTDSIFHKQFLENEKNASLNCIFGPIVEDDQQDEVMEILSNTYKKAYNANQNDLLESRNYLLSVWVPEAVLFSLMKVRKVGRKVAMQQLMNGPRLTKAENEQRHHEIISSATDLSHEEGQTTKLNCKQYL